MVAVLSGIAVLAAQIVAELVEFGADLVDTGRPGMLRLRRRYGGGGAGVCGTGVGA
ncbi:hypothetical protein SHKM778_85870 [Streptomyces sp. KM77-8]|uniref:Uncharacterized protein n=1 Tax=Streptomyces haneummycinicus TaxID=3074435 RepID=A0AAT9HXX3_9ACTN